MFTQDKSAARRVSGYARWIFILTIGCSAAVLPAVDLADYQWVHTVSPLTIQAGQTFVMTLRVADIPNGTVPGHTTKFFLSPDGSITGADFQLGSYTSTGFPPGFYETQGISIAFPSVGSVAPGVYFLGAIIDANLQTGDTSYANNTVLFDQQLTVIAPDLQDDGLSGHQVNPQAISSGQSFNMSIDVRSLSAASGAHVTRFYLSTDATITNGDLLLGTFTSTGIAAGSTEVQSFTITFPNTGTVPLGTYYTGCILDAAGAVDEIDETNNTVLFDQLVSVGAPIFTTHPANLTVSVGQTATFTVVVAGNAAVTYQWNKNSVPIGGATGFTYITPAVALSDDGAVYDVTVNNAVGPTTSNGATLTVNPMTFSVASLPLVAPVGSTTPVSSSFTVTNNSGAAITVTPSAVAAWLTLSAPVTIPAGGSATLTVTADPSGLSGVNSATLTITNSTGEVKTIPVSLTIQSPSKKKKSGCATGTDGSGGGWPWMIMAAGLCLMRFFRPKPALAMVHG